MQDLTELQPKQLEKLLAKANEAEREVGDRLIAEGFGHTRPSELREMAKKDGAPQVVLDFCKARDEWGRISAECERRMTYHGSLKRTKKFQY